MVIVDKALEARARQGKPIRVGMIGAGTKARRVVLQLCGAIQGIELVAIGDTSLEAARQAYQAAGVPARAVTTQGALEDAIRKREPAITDDADLVARAEGVDVVLEGAEDMEPILPMVLNALEHRKHVALMDVQLDVTLGPILKHYADRAGVIITGVDGGAAGVTLNLYRFVRGLGLRPVLCGTIKSAQHSHRVPPPQGKHARPWAELRRALSACGDGTELAFEQAQVANATGMGIARPGMIGPVLPGYAPLQDIAACYPRNMLLNGPGIVDYAVAPHLAPGVFVLGVHSDSRQRQYLNMYKLGEGPFYLFQRPTPLGHFEVPSSLVRAVVFADATVAPLGPPTVDVVAVAKRDLDVGETLDGRRQHALYGQCENAARMRTGRLLPLGIAPGCRLKRLVGRHATLTYDDVELPKNRLCDRLRAEQDALFAPDMHLAAIAG